MDGEWKWAPAENTRLDILKKRCVRGKITKEEFNRMKEDLKEWYECLLLLRAHSACLRGRETAGPLGYARDLNVSKREEKNNGS